MRHWSIVILALAACSVPAPAGDVAADVRQLLDASATAWNRGDLAAFLDDYARDRTTSFVADGAVHYGWDWIRDNYAPSFATDARRDSLRFEGVAARMLGGEHALATARFVLHRGDSVTASGPFTLILRRSSTGWKIVHDHTSRD